MTSSTGDQDHTHVVVVNAAGQHALWPSFAEVPAGWWVVLGATDRRSCLDYVEANWTDIRPTSPVAAITEARP